MNTEDSWWLNDKSTKVTRAWNYSQGFNQSKGKGVRIAVIDGGFSGLNYHMGSGKDLEGQILESEVLNVVLEKNVTFPNGSKGARLENKKLDLEKETNDSITNNSSHGTKVIGTIAARVNNGVGISGIAPGAKIIPIKVGVGGRSASWWEVLGALCNIQCTSSYNCPNIGNPIEDVDVINMSLFTPVGFWGAWDDSFLKEENKAKTSFYNITAELASKGIIFVTIA